MPEKETAVTVHFDSVTVRVVCPYDSVDTETILDVANRAIQANETAWVIPRWNKLDRSDGPEFEAHVTPLGDGEIEDDDREDTPEDFDRTLAWWQAWVKDSQAAD